MLTTGTYYQLFGAGPTSGGNEGLFFDTTSGGLYFTPDASTAIVTSSVYRDPSAWYHIVLSVDTTQATSANREIIYVNGVQVTSYTGTYCAQNTNFNYINVASAQHRIGAHLSSGYYFDGYMAEVNFIDGQALTPSSFGAYDTNGVWQPKKYKREDNIFEYFVGNSRDRGVVKKVRDRVKNVDMLFIDGEHTLEAVIEDFINYKDLVNDGGFIIFDDYNDFGWNPVVKHGVDMIVNEYLFDDYEVLGFVYNKLKATPDTMIYNNEFVLRKKIK